MIGGYCTRPDIPRLRNNLKHTLWRHDMEIYLALCEGNPGDFPNKGPVMQNFDVMFAINLNKLQNNQ